MRWTSHLPLLSSARLCNRKCSRPWNRQEHSFTCFNKYLFESNAFEIDWLFLHWSKWKDRLEGFDILSGRLLLGGFYFPQDYLLYLPKISFKLHMTTIKSLEQ